MTASKYDLRADAREGAGSMAAQSCSRRAAAILSGRLVVTGGGLGNPRPLTAETRVAVMAGK